MAESQVMEIVLSVYQESDRAVIDRRPAFVKPAIRGAVDDLAMKVR